MLKKILIVENDRKYHNTLEDEINDLGYRPISSYTGSDGLQSAKNEKPDLIILDIGLPDMGGLEVCKQIREDDIIKKTPIIILTGQHDKYRNISFEVGADDYMEKPHDPEALGHRINVLLRRAEQPPFYQASDICRLSLICDNHSPIIVRCQGHFICRSKSEEVLNIDQNVLYRLTDELMHASDTWRMHTKQIGIQLYKNLISGKPRIANTIQKASGVVDESVKLSLCFESYADFFKVPIEFLYDKNDLNDYLCLNYPISRYLMDFNPRNPPLSVAFFNNLWEKREQFKILLIGSNTLPNLPNVDEEISLVKKLSEKLLTDKGIPYVINVLPTEQASLETVEDLLKKCQYHLLHIAAHGKFSEHRPDKSHLKFWEKEDRKGNIGELSTSAMNVLLKNSNLRFVYLSCCEGIDSSPSATSTFDDFPGIAHGIIKAGVPAVLGFRSNIKDRSAKTLATSFYKSLYSQGSLDYSLLEARQELAKDDRDDISWISPVLIVQE